MLLPFTFMMTLITGTDMSNEYPKKNLGSIRFTLKREDIMTFVSGLHEIQEDLIEAGVQSKERQGFPEATEVINYIKGLK